MAHSQNTAPQHLFAPALISKQLAASDAGAGSSLPALDIKCCMPPTAASATARPLLDTVALGLSSSDTLASCSSLGADTDERLSVRVDRSRVLGAGQYSTVCLGSLVARDGSERPCAVKIPHPNNLDAQELGLVEAAGLALVGAGATATVRCFGLVDLRSADDDACCDVVPWSSAGSRAVAGDGQWAMVLELCERGTCWEWMLAHRASMDADLFFHWARQLATALAALHAASMAHKDIKGHNMLIDHNGDIRLADFTAAEFSADAIADMRRVCPELDPPSLPAYTDFSGTIPYSAPEALKAFMPLGSLRSGADLHKMDVYSAGVTLYTLFISGIEPYAAVKSSVEQMHLASRGAFWEWEDRHYLTTLPNRSETAPPSPTDAATPELQAQSSVPGLLRSLSLTLGTKSLGRRRTLRSRKAAPREYKRFLSGDMLPTSVETLLRDMVSPDPASRPDATTILERLDSIESEIFEVAE
ncbi:hypothetical protein H4R99_002616 [Coemansia sp. RSA 1722]|nr:hypothetical protein LPJ57_000977 [Coemansia sp. RSA 486]KAJ2232922.1 hypothetical protein IWW45_004599 [Coemansia sp. RSA 485]KAJ2599845.1 hypothetical protein GGF39_002060 [Coemansia sp. RSA 1721]KAJ2602651.1 hypothetical protein H4R99_002616 [Coemansia sp. RSA 1722]KAJ2637739.1 hypothetical protein GGF40_002153 [Coemansia sp. RSA 1286]